jgi:hypothetical protein
MQIFVGINKFYIQTFAYAADHDSLIQKKGYGK